MNNSLDYKIGNIEARLNENDRSHAEMKNYLFNIQSAIDRVEGIVNSNNVDIARIKGKASVLGTIAGFLAATIVSVVGWFVMRR